MIEGEWQLAGEGITGWARDAERSRPLWVELWVDNELMGIALADLPQPENCGFWLPLGPAARDTAREIMVCAANTGEELPGRTEITAEAVPVSQLMGAVQVDRGLTVSGWVLDPAKSEEMLQLHAEVDDERVVNVIAGERRYRPAQADGHGFSLQLPERYADGESHIVRILDERGRAVPGCPFRVRSLSQNLGVWFKGQKKVEKPMQELVGDLLEHLEERLPGLLAESAYSAWKKAFPVPQAQGRQKVALSVPGQKSSALLKGQQGVELKDGKDHVFLPGSAVRLHAHALGQLAAALRASGAGLVYADGETETGEPLFKPAFDREAFLAQDYLGPILATRDVAEEADVKAGDDPAEARFRVVMAAMRQGKIAHLPMPLSVETASWQPDRSKIISEWLGKNYPGARWDSDRVHYALPRKPLVSIIIPTRDHGDLLKVCLDSLAQTDWPDYEIIIVDNGSVEDNALAVMENAETAENICVLRRPGVFNYAALNNDAARQAKGELICLLNNDTEAIDPQWLAEMAALLLMAGKEGGAVGAKLLWPNGLVQHGGVIIGTHQLASHVGNAWLAEEPGYMNRNQFAQQYSAVTAACLLTPRELFLQAGGFDARRFPIAFNDVDYCLRLGGMGRKIYWTPHAKLMHHESASRGTDAAGSAKARAEREGRIFRTLWGHYDDIFYNPNLPLSAAAEPFQGLAFPPRQRRLRIVR